MEQTTQSTKIHIPDGNFVQLEDFLFELHGLGPKYGLVYTVNDSMYVYLANDDTAFDIVSPKEPIVDLGSFDDLADDPLTIPIINTFITRHREFPASQLVALALIRAQVDPVDANDEVGLHRLAYWALCYQKRACWIVRNKQQAYAKQPIHWKGLGL